MRDGLQICWWITAHPLYTERHEIEMGREPRLKHRVSEGGRECCRRAGGDGVMQNEEEPPENLNCVFVQTSIVLCCSI